MPLFAGLAEASHWQGVRFCTGAAAGDAVLTLTIYWLVAALGRDRRWVLRPRPWTLTLFVGTGLAATIVLEGLATGPLDRWHYAPATPTLPVLGTGLVPLALWLVLPLLVLGIVRRQLSGPTTAAADRPPSRRSRRRSPRG